MKHPLVETLEKRLLPEFEEIAGRIRQEIPNVSARIESSFIGSDEHLGHYYAISCLLKPSWEYEVDLVELCVEISRLVSTPKIHAYVCWGHPSGYIEADFPINSNLSVEASDKNLEELYQDLPRLYEALFEALRRRKPRDL